MGTQFACPSPRGSNNAQLFLTKAGHLVDRHGRNWGRSSMRGLAQDAALASPTSNGPKKPFNPLASSARSDHDGALKELCAAMGWEHEKVAGQIGEILDEAEREQVQAHAASLGAGAGKGAGALDDTDVDEDEVEERVREYLASKGLADDDIEEALKRVKADRAAAAKDKIPKSGLFGTGGHTSRGPSGSSRDDEAAFEKEFPIPAVTRRDVYGAPRGDYDPVREAGVRATERLPGGGVSRRTSAGDAAICASDEELAREYPGIERVTAGI